MDNVETWIPYDMSLLFSIECIPITENIRHSNSPCQLPLQVYDPLLGRIPVLSGTTLIGTLTRFVTLLSNLFHKCSLDDKMWTVVCMVVNLELDIILVEEMTFNHDHVWPRNTLLRQWLVTGMDKLTNIKTEN